VFEVKKELLDSHEALLDVTIEEPTVQNAMRSAARHISTEINIPGFRKGKAPYAVVLRYVGEGAVMQEAADHLLEELYPKFIESAEITPYTSGNLENVDINPMVFKIRVPLQPTVVLGDYNGIRKPWEDPTVNDEEIAMVLDQMREEHATVEPVDRPAEMGDEIHINIKGMVNNEVVVDEEDIQVVLSAERPFISISFVEALLGISNGETRIFTVPLPNELENEELRGAETEFTATTTEVYQRALPGLDDAFASTVGAFETLEALRQDIFNRILQSKQKQMQEAYRTELVDMLIELAEVHFPPIAVSEMLDDMVEETDKRMQRERQMSLEDALRLEGRTVEQFREELTPQAENRVKTSLALSEFARLEGTAVTDDEVVLEYNNFFSNIDVESLPELPALSLDSDFARNIRSNMLGRKTLARLEQIGRGLIEVAEVKDSAAADSAVVAADSAVVAADGEVAPEDSAVIPEDSAAVPEDSAVVAEDSAVVPEDSEVVPGDNDVVPEDSDVIPEDSDVVVEEGTVEGNNDAPAEVVSDESEPVTAAAEEVDSETEN
jgi:trigger factor